MPIYAAKCPDCGWQNTFFAHSLSEAEEDAANQHFPDISRHGPYPVNPCQSSLRVRPLKRKIVVEE